MYQAMNNLLKGSQASISLFTMVFLPETPVSGSTPNLLQMHNMIAAKRNAINPTRPAVALSDACCTNIAMAKFISIFFCILFYVCSKSVSLRLLWLMPGSHEIVLFP